LYAAVVERLFESLEISLGCPGKPGKMFCKLLELRPVTVFKAFLYLHAEIQQTAAQP
jgi:hypothetical protein